MSALDACEDAKQSFEASGKAWELLDKMHVVSR
jgi:hypothetical protein